MSGVLDNLKNQLKMYTVQRDQAQVNFQQLCGAIHVLSETITAIEAVNEAEKNDPQECPPQAQPDCEIQIPSAE